MTWSAASSSRCTTATSQYGVDRRRRGLSRDRAASPMSVKPASAKGLAAVVPHRRSLIPECLQTTPYGLGVVPQGDP